MSNKVVPTQITSSENGVLVFLMSNGQVLRYSGAAWTEIKIPENLITKDSTNLLTEG